MQRNAALITVLEWACKLEGSASSGFAQDKRCASVRLMRGRFEGDLNAIRLTGDSAYRRIDGREPVVAVGLCAAGDGEEFCLQFKCNGAGDAFADRDVVDRADGGEFDGGADEEDFVRDVKHLARDDGFLAGNVQILGEFHDRVASDTRKNAGGEGRCVEHAVVHKEHVHPGAFADVALGIEGDAFGVAVEGGFHSNELRIHVIRGGLGRSEEHTSELQSLAYLVCRLLLEKKKNKKT